ncbi:type II toxin-antitoxin system RelE/ParE family toxin [Streptomyces yangpuensis]|uniref:type II toxin-antitoxin system RelE/ParE family toxin n=1 Tax=Streptomyces yangpuensis TaxID=1648182 RepID=UPI0038135669
MNEYRTVFRPEAQVELREITRDMALRNLAKPTEPTEPETDSRGFNTTALVSQPERRRLRVREYRVAHTIDSGEWVVRGVHVGRRSTVYETWPRPAPRG